METRRIDPACLTSCLESAVCILNLLGSAASITKIGSRTVREHNGSLAHRVFICCVILCINILRPSFVRCRCSLTAYRPGIAGVCLYGILEYED